MLTLPESLGLKEAAAVMQSLRAQMRRESGAQTVIDAAALRHFDSSALAVLLDCKREAARQQKDFTLQGAPPKLLALADLYGVRELLGT